MSDPVFVLTSEYQSYGTFWDLVRLSGFPVVRHDAVDLGWAGTYIFPTFDEGMMSCLEGAPQGVRKSKAVFWYLERPDANLRSGMDLRENYSQAMDQILTFADEIWVSDRLVHSLDARAKFVVFGGHEGLATEPPQEKIFDVLHFGEETPRRKAVLDKLSENCTVVTRAWGTSKAMALASSKLLLIVDRVNGLHVSDSLRWVLAAAYRLPVLQERLRDPYPIQDTILMTSYENLAETAREVLKTLPLQDLGNALFETYCRKWTFRRGVLEALS